MTSYYLIRHGQHDRLAGDQPLNAVGREQAKITARHLAALPIDAVYASPLARARETGETIATGLGLPLAVDDRLRERANFGDKEGQTFEEFVQMWQRCDRDRDYVPILGLSARANGERLASWIHEVRIRYPGGHVVACSHGGTISDFLLNVFPEPLLERYRPDFRHHFGNCSITTIAVDNGGYMLHQLADDQHIA